MLDESGNETNGSESDSERAKDVLLSGASRLAIAKFANRETAIKMVNPAKMEDRAYRDVYNKTVLPRYRRPLMWLLTLQAKYCEHLPAARLHEAVQEANETTPPTARQQCRYTADLGLITAVYDEEDATKITHYFLSDEQFALVNRLIGHLDLIPKVIAKQVAKPYDPTAGSKLLPASVYDNIIAQFNNDNIERKGSPIMKYIASAIVAVMALIAIAARTSDHSTAAVGKDPNVIIIADDSKVRI